MANEEKEILDEPINIGELLQKARESQSVSIKEASQVTKLSIHTISSIEQNDFKAIGAPVYVRGYIGIYAKFLNLDGDQLTEIYDQQNPAPKIEIVPPKTGGAYLTKENTIKKRHSKTLAVLIIIAFLGFAFWGYLKLEPILFEQKADQLDSTEMNTISVTPKLEPAKDQVSSLSDSTEITLNPPIRHLIEQTKEAENIANHALEQSDHDAQSDLKTTDESSDINPFETDQEPEKETISNPVTDTTLSDDKLDDPDVLDPTKPVVFKMLFTDDCWIKVVDAAGKTIAGNYSSKKPLNEPVLFPLKVSIGRIGAVGQVFIADKAVNISDYKAPKGRLTYNIKLL